MNGTKFVVYCYAKGNPGDMAPNAMFENSLGDKYFNSSDGRIYIVTHKDNGGFIIIFCLFLKVQSV